MVGDFVSCRNPRVRTNPPLHQSRSPNLWKKTDGFEDGQQAPLHDFNSRVKHLLAGIRFPCATASLCCPFKVSTTTGSTTGSTAESTTASTTAPTTIIANATTTTPAANHTSSLTSKPYQHKQPAAGPAYPTSTKQHQSRPPLPQPAARLLPPPPPLPEQPAPRLLPPPPPHRLLTIPAA